MARGVGKAKKALILQGFERGEGVVPDAACVILSRQA